MSEPGNGTEKPVAGIKDANGVFDLIYHREAMGDFRRLFPTAKIEDASDTIHEGRFSVEIKDTTSLDYLETIAVNGLSNISLKFAVMAGTKSELRAALHARLKAKGLLKGV